MENNTIDVMTSNDNVPTHDKELNIDQLNSTTNSRSNENYSKIILDNIDHRIQVHCETNLQENTIANNNSDIVKYNTDTTSIDNSQEIKHCPGVIDTCKDESEIYNSNTNENDISKNDFDGPLSGNTAIEDILPSTAASDDESATEESDTSYSTIENIDDVFEELKRMNVLWPLKNAIDVNGELIYEFIKQVKVNNEQLYTVSNQLSIKIYTVTISLNQFTIMPYDPFKLSIRNV